MLKSHLISSLDEFLQMFHKSSKRILLLVGEECDFEHNLLSRYSGEVYGAIFPQVIFEQKNYTNAIVAIELSEKTNVTLNSFDNFKYRDIDENKSDILVFVDGLSAGITDFLESLYESTQIETNILGGGAGKLTLKQEPVLFTKDEIIQDGALIVTGLWNFSVSVKHGWERISDPHIATDAEKIELHALDYEDAFEVYRREIEENSGNRFTDNNFFDIAKSYPLGISTVNDEIIVRDPIYRKDGSLILVGDIDQNSIVYILKGEKEKLINAAYRAAQEAVSKYENVQNLLMIDCISRVLFLGNDFDLELQAVAQSIQNRDVMMFGVLTLGEIANVNEDYIDFYNKTCVIGAFK